MKERKRPQAGERADPLLKRIDDALATWPEGKPSSEPTGDALARATSGKTPDSPGALSDDDLLAAPLPMSESDAPGKIAVGSTNPAVETRVRERVRPDFADLARFASTAGVAGRGPGANRAGADENEENSGVIDLRAIAAGAAQKERATDRTETARPAGAAPAPKSPNGLDESTRRASRRRVAAWLAVMALVAGSAAVAGVLYGMKRARGPASAASETTSQPATGAASAPAGPAPTPRLEDTKALGALPAAAPPPSAQDFAGAATAPTKRSFSPPSPSPAVRADRAAADRGVPGVSATSRAGDSNLQALMQQAAGVTSARSRAVGASPLDPIESSSGSVPLRPALGAVQGAVGTTLPAARACLGADDPIARATITFGSDGIAKSVGVSGDAAGKPAEGCIRAALLGTRLPAFANPTFTWTTTVRPP